MLLQIIYFQFDKVLESAWVKDEIEEKVVQFLSKFYIYKYMRNIIFIVLFLTY